MESSKEEKAVIVTTKVQVGAKEGKKFAAGASQEEAFKKNA